MPGKKIFATKVASYTLMNIIVYKLEADEVLCQCVPEHERQAIIHEAHSGLADIHFEDVMIA